MIAWPLLRRDIFTRGLPMWARNSSRMMAARSAGVEEWFGDLEYSDGPRRQ